MYRLFGAHNDTTFNSYVYSLESYWIEMLQISQHRWGSLAACGHTCKHIDTRTQ